MSRWEYKMCRVCLGESETEICPSCADTLNVAAMTEAQRKKMYREITRDDRHRIVTGRAVPPVLCHD